MKIVYKFLILTCMILFLFPVTVHADTGPKPSVVIEINGLEEERYYVTLLSEKESTGPWSHDEQYQEYHGDKTV